MAKNNTIYRCRTCGATSYQPVIERAKDGVLKPTGQTRCTGCRNIFATIRAWWEPQRRADFQTSQMPG